MKAPAFWSKPAGLWSALLSPLGALYTAGTARRVAQQGLRLPVPVISVGNLNVGGTGKTPLVMDLIARLDGAHVVTRGHGGRLTGPIRVDPGRHSAEDVGDEPLLLAAFGPVWVSRDRAAGGQAAVAAGATAILLDDAHQNPALDKDLSILMIDAETGFGNGKVLPAGPLREPVERGLARADLTVVLGPPGVAYAPPADLPSARGHLAPLQTGMAWEGLPVFAFAGIGRPEKFFATLRALGADVKGTEALADHQPLTPALCRRLGERAARLSAQPVTTEKDAVRLPASLRGKVLVLPVRIAWDQEDALTNALARLNASP